jgi:hypothetical protein
LVFGIQSISDAKPKSRASNERIPYNSSNTGLSKTTKAWQHMDGNCFHNSSITILVDLKGDILRQLL